MKSINPTRAFKLTLLGVCILSSVSQSTNAYQIITPKTFSVVNRNYLKLQIQQERGDDPIDSAFFDIVYNSEKRSVVKLDKSLSHVITLNDFNDGVFYVQGRVYHHGQLQVLGSMYHPFGIPVILDRNPVPNNIIFRSSWLRDRKKLNEQLKSIEPYESEVNNNTLKFVSAWDTDSLYFQFEISDANLNANAPLEWDLFHKKKYLKALWVSDCIEIGFDLKHDRSEWKKSDDYELVVDMKGNHAGNRWSIADSLFDHWGDKTRVDVTFLGTINENQDSDHGFSISLAIPWSELNIRPDGGQVIGFDIQLYDKDGDLDDAFRTSVSGTNPESNDNTSEWTSLVLEPRPSFVYGKLLYVFLPLLLFFVGLFYFYRRKYPRIHINDGPDKRGAPQPADYGKHTEAAVNYIAKHYVDPELSRHKIAEQVFVSEKYLSSLFKKEMGVNLVLYINKFRIEKSIHMLRETKLTISEIAFKVGFNSLQNFNKNFKTVTQKTPSEYRSKVLTP